MSNIEKVKEFLDKTKIYYFLTIDGDKPKGRPFGSLEIINGKLYICTGRHKKVFAQIQANPKVEILALGQGEFIRVDGVAVVEEDESIAKNYVEKSPHLHRIYNEETGLKPMMLYLDQAETEILDASGKIKEKFNF